MKNSKTKAAIMLLSAMVCLASIILNFCSETLVGTSISEAEVNEIIQIAVYAGISQFYFCSVLCLVDRIKSIGALIFWICYGILGSATCATAALILRRLHWHFQYLSMWVNMQLEYAEGLKDLLNGIWHRFNWHYFYYFIALTGFCAIVCLFRFVPINRACKRILRRIRAKFNKEYLILELDQEEIDEIKKKGFIRITFDEDK